MYKDIYPIRCSARPEYSIDEVLLKILIILKK